MKGLRQTLDARAFTLVELLVVIAVIAILASLLLPALSRAKAKGNATKCISNLKQWGIAGIGYFDDNEGFLPLESSRTNGGVDMELWGDVQASPDAWYNAVPDRPASSMVGFPFYKASLFHCPSARFPSGVEQLPNAYFSLAMNSKLIMPPTFGPHFSIRADTIQQPWSTPWILDSRVSEAEYNVGGVQTLTRLGQPAIFSTRFAARHNQRGNMVFFDGHVSAQLGTDIVETRPGFPPGSATFPNAPVTWCADPLMDPNN